jgi:hypothetical protein
VSNKTSAGLSQSGDRFAELGICARLNFFQEGKRKMKKILSLALLLGSLGIVTPLAQASPSNNALQPAGVTAPQQFRRYRLYQRRYYRPVATTTQVRNVRIGWHIYREVYQTTLMPNGMQRTRLVSRYMIR